ncbi:MAG: imidazolonepropionase [Nitriliruptorales bacterium]
MSDLLLTGIGELVTNRDGAEDLVGAVPDAAVAVRDGRIVWVGPESDLPPDNRELPTLDCAGRAVIPGFVDAHTHVVFAGDRSDEFARRLRGESYEEVLAYGGGIRATVGATRQADLDGLVAESSPRLAAMLAAGTTTAEVKSGYGLDTATERRQLEAVGVLAERTPVDLVSTFLGAHVVDAEFTDDRDGFVDLVVSEMLPACAPLASYCDVFCDRGAFTVEETRRILVAARDNGLGLRMHAEELARTGGAALAAELGAASADHLVHVNDEDIGVLAAAGTAAVLLPATSFSLRSSYAPGPAMFAAGVTVALATDCNPGTSYVTSMPFVVALGCLEMGLTPEQALWAATRGGALALEDHDKGQVGPGAAADLVVLDAPTYRHLPYRPGSDLVAAVFKDGRLVSGSLK